MSSAVVLVVTLLGSPALAQSGPGRILGEPQDDVAGSASSFAVTPILVVAGAIAVLCGLLAVTYFSNQRRLAEIHEPTEDELRTARAEILAARRLEDLCSEAAYQGRNLVGSDAVYVAIEELYASAGESFGIGEDVLARIDREKALVKAKGGLAIAPFVYDDEVVGYIAAVGGHTESLSAVARYVSDGYTAYRANSSGAAQLTPAPANGEVDGLTGVANRRRFDQDLAGVAEAEDEDAPISLAMFDVDDFRHYNEAHGKHAGNEVLRSIAELIAGRLRETDVVYRYSGVKFVALLPGATVENAYVVVDRIRRAVESTEFDGEEVQPTGRVTMSVGIAEAPVGDTASLVAAADSALAQAKLDGRNCVVIEGDIK